MSIFAFITVLLTYLISTVSYAQAQRMALVPKAYSIAPMKSIKADAYCLDYKRLTPTVETSYTQLFSSSRDILVSVGTKFIPFDQVIKEHKIAIEGTGKPNALSIKNLTKEHINISFGHLAFLGETGDKPPQLDVNDIQILDSQSSHEDIQYRLWATEILKSNGYAITGNSVSERENAIFQFQNDYHLKKTGNLDSETIRELDLFDKIKQKAIMADDQYAIIWVNKEDKPTKTAFFRVRTYGEKPLLVDKVNNIIEFAAKQAQATTAKRSYLVLEGFNQEELSGFSASLEFQNNQPKLKIDLLGSNDIEAILTTAVLSVQRRFQIEKNVFDVYSESLISKEIQNNQSKNKITLDSFNPDLFNQNSFEDFAKAMDIILASIPINNHFRIDYVEPIREIKSGPKKGFWSGTIKINTESFFIIIKITAKFAEWIKYFVARLEAHILNAGSSEISTLALVHKARADVKKHYHLTEQQLDKMFKDSITDKGFVQILQNLWIDRVANVL